MVFLLLGMAIVAQGCAGVRISPPIPIDQRQDFRQENSYGGKGAFYYHSHLLIVNASQYKIRFVMNGRELPMFYYPQQEGDIEVNNRLHETRVVNMIVVAYSQFSNRVAGTAERTFTFNGDGQQIVEQWVVKDWMFAQ